MADGGPGAFEQRLCSVAAAGIWSGVGLCAPVGVPPAGVRLPRNRSGTAESLPVGLPSTLLERRPDVRQAEQKLIAANASVGLAYTNMFPRLALTAHYGLESAEFSDF